MKFFDSHICRWAGLVALFVLLAACAAGPRIRTDFDPEADFGRYRTYAFYQPIAMEASGYSTFITDRIKTNVRREMEARGYTYDETSPDLRVNFQGIVEERTDVYSTPQVDYQYYYSYRARSYVAVPVWYDQAHVSRYTQGTLSVDLVEAARNRMVWTGDAIGRVTQRTPQERAEQVDRSIMEIFLRYPYRAGSAQPVVAD
ncbi:MAG: DUF4136 domain-containing protein [Thermomonas sp.]